MDRETPILVAGAGGFIGGHLVRKLVEDGYRDVIGVDLKPLDQWWQRCCFGRCLDLSRLDACLDVTRERQVVFNLASDMGGMGFIETHRTDCMLSVLINTHLLMAARESGVERFFYSSSACIYPQARQSRPDARPLRESDAYPADCEDGYGWEKLFSERMCRHFGEDFSIETRVARLHNVYGPHGSWSGGREKVPAAICRKVAEAEQSGEPIIDIWGDGEQTRSFLYVDDCVHGTLLLTDSPVHDPINLGSSEIVTINQLVDAVESIAGVKLRRRYVSGPLGVRGRSSDNTLITNRLGWEPSTALAEGLEPTYRWIYDQVVRR